MALLILVLWVLWTVIVWGAWALLAFVGEPIDDPNVFWMLTLFTGLLWWGGTSMAVMILAETANRHK